MQDTYSVNGLTLYITLSMDVMIVHQTDLHYYV